MSNLEIPDRETRKAVVLARGMGKRMRAAHDDTSLTPEQKQTADRGIKAMIPIGRPFLDYSLSALADAGCRDICLVIGPEHGVIRDYYASIKPSRVRISFAVQQQPLGTADALRAAREFTGSECFLMINSDNYYPVKALRKLRAVGTSGAIGFERSGLLQSGAISEDRLRAYATLQVDGSGHLLRVEEKPGRIEADAIISMNAWSFTPLIYCACEAITPSARGEYEIASAVEYAMRELAVRFRVISFCGEVLDLSTRADITAIASRLRGLPVEL